MKKIQGGKDKETENKLSSIQAHLGNSQVTSAFKWSNGSNSPKVRERCLTAEGDTRSAGLAQLCSPAGSVSFPDRRKCDRNGHVQITDSEKEHPCSSSRALPRSVRRTGRSGVFSDPHHVPQQLFAAQAGPSHTPCGHREAEHVRHPASSATRTTQSLLCCTHLNLDLQFSLSLPKCASEIPCRI